VHSDAARRFFAAAEKRWTQLLAPDFWITECANGCWKRVQRRLNTKAEAMAALAIVRALPVIRIDATNFDDAVMHIALSHGTSCYAALYVATAQFADVPLVTADPRLVQLLKDSAWSGRVFHLSEW
jgi:predicted nucleic acid-binding protein